MPAAKSNPVIITRRFAAPRALVWDCYTKEEHLRNWWGPKGFRMLKCSLDLRIGGTFLYGMESPNGQAMWGKWVFHKIEAPHLLAHTVSFCDENGVLAKHPMAPVWPPATYSEATFEEVDGETDLHLVWEAGEATEAEIEIFNSMHASMNAGCEGTFQRLDDYLKSA